MKRSGLITLLSLAWLTSLLAAPQAHAQNENNWASTVEDQTCYVGAPVSLTLPVASGTGCPASEAYYFLTPNQPRGSSRQFEGGSPSLQGSTPLLPLLRGACP